MPSVITAVISARLRVPKNNTMKKIICIGECSLNIVLDAAGRPQGSVCGGRVANAATIMARRGMNVLMASDVCADPVGDIIIAGLSEAGVDVTSVDRFTEGRSALNVFTQSADGALTVTRYEQYPEEAFDIIWPRIDEGDIVLFGGYYAIDRRMRSRLAKFLANAKERKAVLVYLPGFMPEQEPRITRVMPQLIENFEIADVLVTRTKDLRLIYGEKTPDECYRNHIDFYCRSLVNVDPESSCITYYSGKETSRVEIPAGTASTMLWNAGAVVGLVAAILDAGIASGQLDMPNEPTREKLLRAAAESAREASAAFNESWQLIE